MPVRCQARDAAKADLTIAMSLKALTGEAGKGPEAQRAQNALAFIIINSGP